MNIKKTYVAPMATLAECKTEGLICVSTTISITNNVDDEITAGEQMLSKEHTFDVWE